MQPTDVYALAPYLERGGTEKHILTLTQALPSDYLLQVLAPPGPAQSEFVAAGISVQNFRSLSEGLFTGAQECRRVLRKSLHTSNKQHQLVHVHGAAELLWLAHTVTRVPIVFTVHGYHGKGAPISYKIAAILGNRYADAVIAVSRSEQELLLSAGLRPNKLHLVYNGVSKPGELAIEEAQAWTNKWLETQTDKRILIGTVARLVPVKGLNYLIEAMQLLTQHISKERVHLVIFGDGPDKAALQQQAASLGISDSVEFCGYYPQVASLMPLWDIFVLPSVVEPFGLVCAEAMAAGLPVIATNTGGIPEVIGTAGLLVPAQDANALAEAMLSLVKDAKTRSTLGAAGYRRFSELFTAEVMAQKTAAIYDSVLGLS